MMPGYVESVIPTRMMMKTVMGMMIRATLVCKWRDHNDEGGPKPVESSSKHILLTLIAAHVVDVTNGQ
ncbi:unnamed protein product, partial [Linum tenue]